MNTEYLSTNQGDPIIMSIAVHVHGTGQYGGIFPAETYVDALNLVSAYLSKDWVQDIDVRVDCVKG